MAIDISVRVESVVQLTDLADLLLRRGAVGEAARLYRIALGAAPSAPHLHARLGLALRPSPRTLTLLDAIQALERSKEMPFVSDGLITWSKTLPFLEDSRFVELTAKHIDLSPAANWQWQLQTIVWALNQTRTLDGDLVELGVFKGHTTLFSAEYVNFKDWPKKWWLYDTFSGIPADQMDAGWAEGNARSYNSETFSYEEVRNRFAEFSNISVIMGRVPEILIDNCPERISFMHIDMNNAAAEIGALDLLFDRVVPGGIIVFDDYAWSISIAQHKAIESWCAEKGLKVLSIPTGQGLLIKSPSGA